MKKFDITYTQTVKGIAILILLVHHLFGVKYILPMKVIKIQQLITCITKVCVALFTIMSGYGITKSYEKNKESDKRFILLHIKKLLINYWYIYIPVFILSFFQHVEGTPSIIYGPGINGIKNFVLDFIGMKALFNTPTLNQTWWYLEVIIVCYLLYPVLYKTMKKSTVLSIIFSIVPCMIADLLCFKMQYKIADRAVFYIFDFILGMILANNRVLDNIVNYCNKKLSNRIITILVSLLGIVVFGTLSTLFTFIPHVLNALSIIILIIGVKVAKNIFNNILEFIGKYSMNIFFTHSFFYCYFIVFYNMIKALKYKTIQYIVLLVISLSVSYTIELLKIRSKQFIDTKFNII